MTIDPTTSILGLYAAADSGRRSNSIVGLPARMLAMADKQQFNVYLPPELIRRVKHASVDSRQSLSAFVADALEAALEASEAPRTSEAPQTSGTSTRAPEEEP